MATRQELGAKLMQEMERLNDDIFSHHKSYAGTTYIGEVSMNLIDQACSEYRERLAKIRKTTAKEYLALAPEMRSQFEHDVWQLESAISDFRSTIRDVHSATQARNRIEDDPLRPTGGGLARRTGPNELTTVRDTVVPIIRNIPSGFLGLSTTPVVVGHARKKIVKTFDNRGRPKTMQVYDLD